MPIARNWGLGSRITGRPQAAPAPPCSPRGETRVQCLPEFEAVAGYHSAQPVASPAICSLPQSLQRVQSARPASFAPRPGRSSGSGAPNQRLAAVHLSHESQETPNGCATQITAMASTPPNNWRMRSSVCTHGAGPRLASAAWAGRGAWRRGRSEGLPADLRRHVLAIPPATQARRSQTLALPLRARSSALAVIGP
jgi:hypothetical protein